MATYTVDFARAHAVVASMEQIDTKIRTMLTTLEQDSEKSLAEWRSEAQVAYRTCKAKWDASAANMPALLAQARSSLGEIMTGYKGVESTVTNLFPAGR